MAVAITAIGFFIPIFAFLFVFIVVYAMLFKTQILGENQFIMLFISFILASFFIIQTSLVEFVRFTSAWFSVGVIVLFFFLVIISFIPGKFPEKLTGLMKPVVIIPIVIIMIIFFIISAGYVFDLAIKFGSAKDILNNEIVGMILLLVIAFVVSWRIKKG